MNLLGKVYEYGPCLSFFPVYLLIGVTVMTLTLSVIYSVPEFDLTTFFLLNCASGKAGNSGAGAGNIGSNAGNGSSSADPGVNVIHAFKTVLRQF